LRVGIAAGMVTMIWEGDGVRLTIWGNADEALRRAWNTLASAVAKASDGHVVAPKEARSVEDSQRSAES
jgi:hypothetical protein